MRRSKSEPITNLLNEFLRDNGLETPLNQHRLINSWEEVTGRVIARYTSELYIQNQTLYVKLTSAPLKSDLMMGRANLVKMLNEHVGSYVISDIVFK